LIILFLFGNRTYYLLSLCFLFLIFFGIVFVVFYKHFGKFTREGRIINLKWQGFKRYITDFSDIKNHPPKHVILWEEFLVYATAFGVAKKVIKNIKTLNPQEYNNSRIALYSGFVVSNSFSNLNKMSSSGGSGGGFGGGAGGGGAGGR
jgi:uncharacterized membrane protein